MGAGGAGVGTTGSETTSPREVEGPPFLFEMKSGEGVTHSSRKNMGSGNSAGVTGSAGTSRRSNLRTSSGCGSSQRLSGGTRDHSVTQFALIDDENVSALQQVR